MRVFYGCRLRSGDTAVVVLEGGSARPLRQFLPTDQLPHPRWDWGRRSPGAEALALAILTVSLNDPERAKKYVPEFLADVLDLGDRAAFAFTEMFARKWASLASPGQGCEPNVPGREVSR